MWEDHDHIRDDQAKIAIRETVRLLDEGQIRVANPNEDGSWSVNEWVKKAILLYFPIQRVETQTAGPMEYNDKIPLKNGFDRLGVRVVPPAVARYGAYLAPGSILMPCYVNIGAYVDTGSLVDTWATVGSCAQIGKNVHLSGGVGIGGVLEPIQGSPVIIEDECFIGSRCIVVEGAHIRKGAVLGAGVVITGSTKIIDVSGPEPRRVPRQKCPTLGGDSRHAAQKIPRRAVRRAVRADYRQAQGLDRRENHAQRRAAHVRRDDLTLNIRYGKRLSPGERVPSRAPGRPGNGQVTETHRTNRRRSAERTGRKQRNGQEAA